MGAGGVLLLLTLGFFWRTVSGDVYQPADGGDLASFLFPTYRFAAAQLHQWALPLWNPHLYGGAPFIGDIQAGFLYPPNLAMFVLYPEFAYSALQWFAIGHIYWAGLGLYCLLRTVHWVHWNGRPVGRGAALFAALAFQFSDPLLIHLGNLNLIAVLSWLPWVLAAHQRALAEGRLRWAALAALLFALANYAGHAQSTLYVGLALAVYTLLWATLNPDVAESGKQFTSLWSRISTLRPLFFLIFVLLLTFFLSAPILLPALELSRFTERSHFTYQDTAAFSLAPTQAIGLLTPGFFGHGPALHWSLWDRVETPYAGVATLLLALGGVLLPGQATRRRLWPWLGLALFGFLVALGVYAIFHGWLTLLLPGFGQFRAPARALALWTLAIAVLAAVGLDWLGRENDQEDEMSQEGQMAKPIGPIHFAPWPLYTKMLKTGALILVGIFTPLIYVALLLTQSNETVFVRASVAALAMVFAAAFWLGTWALIAARRASWLSVNAFNALMIAWLFFDLSATGAYTDVSSNSPTAGYRHPEITAFLKNDPDLFRIDTRTDIAGLWQPDAAALYGLQDVGGVANPLALRHWNALWEATGGRHTRLYDMLNVKYVLARNGTPLPDKFVLALDAPGELAVYRNTAFTPRAWLVHEAELAPDVESALTALQAADFDPQRKAVIHSPAIFPALAPAQGAESVRVIHYGNHELTLEVQAAASGILVISEVWYPGWQATVNGAPAEVMQANGALRAMAAPAGMSRVELRFAPAAWLWGMVAFAIGLLLAAVVFVG
jgi:hypothetical protein